MTELDIRGNGLAILGLIGREIVADLPPPRREEAEAIVEAAGGLLIQVLVDLNRIAAALEHIALK
jgi:hypothetical protein